MKMISYWRLDFCFRIRVIAVLLSGATLVTLTAQAGPPQPIDLLSGLDAPATASQDGRISIGILPVLRADNIAGLVRKPDSDLRRLPEQDLPFLIGVRYNLGGKPVEYLLSARSVADVMREGLAHALQAGGYRVLPLAGIPMDSSTNLIETLKAQNYDPAPAYVVLCVTRALAFDVGPFQKGLSTRVRYMTRPHIRVELTVIDLEKGQVAWQGVLSHWYDSFGDPYESAGPAAAKALIPVAFADFLREQVREQTALNEVFRP